MPVTAKLSQKFYERLGDDITTELVDWFNAVDTEYQRQYREANDLNWERFKAELNGGLNSLRAELHGEINALRSELRSEMNTGFAALRLEMERLRSSMMKWMFVYWSGMMATQAALLYAVLGR